MSLLAPALPCLVVHDALNPFPCATLLPHMPLGLCPSISPCSSVASYLAASTQAASPGTSIIDWFITVQHYYLSDYLL